MNNSTELILDPAILCLPNPCSSGEQLEAFVESLLGWSGLFNQKGAVVLISDATRIALHDDGEYPHRHRLAVLLKEHEIQIADEETIAKLTDGLLKRMPSFEEYFEIDAILFDEHTTDISPDFFRDRLKAKCKYALTEILVVIAIAELFRPTGSSTSPGLISAINEKEQTLSPSEVIIESELHDISFQNDSVNSLKELPYKVDARIPVYFSHTDYMNRLGICTVWNNAADNESAIAAINLCIENLLYTCALQNKPKSYELGPHFLKSVRDWGVATRSDYSMVLIETISRIILGIPKSQLNEFRINKKSTAEQRSREDGAKAFRTHLTKKGAGLRLMFWEKANGAIEFANVGDKDELHIYE